MIRKLMVGLAAAIAFALASPAMAQQTALGPYCGEVTWQGQSPIDVWVFLRRDQSWTAAVSGALSEVDRGSYTQSGATVTMIGGQPGYQVTATVSGARLIGQVTAADGRRGTFSVTQMRGTGSGLRSSPLPPQFVPEEAEEALAGSMRGLSRAFAWGWSPQGVEYWSTIHQSGQLPDHAVDALRDWIQRARAGERPVCDAQ